MFAIRFKGTDKWVGKQNISYAISDDGYYKQQDPSGVGGFNGYRFSPEDASNIWGKRPQYRKIWEDTSGMRRSLGFLKGATMVHDLGGGLGVLGPEKGTIGTFSYFEVVNIITGSVHSLEDVFNKVI